MIAASRHSLRPGGGSPPPLRDVTTSTIVPANRNRTELWVKGGIVPTATRIARYVDPQTTYRAPRASAT